MAQEEIRRETTEEQVSDEEILNILRRADDVRLSTSEIADELPITQRRTVDRLKDLQDLKPSRVIQRKYGQGYVWSLGEAEPDTPVSPELERVVWISTKLRAYGNDIWTVGKAVVALGVGIIFVSLTAILQSFSLPVVGNMLALAIGYATIAGGGGSIAIGGLLQLIGIVTPRISEQRKHVSG